MSRYARAACRAVRRRVRGLIRRAAGTVAAAAGAGVLAAGMVVAAPGATGVAEAATVTGAEAALPANAGPNPQLRFTSVSCASAGNCTAVGQYVDSAGNTQGLLLSQTAGTWATGLEAALPANAGTNPGLGNSILASVSCASPGNCSAVGNYVDSAGNRQGLLLTETSGTWAAGVEALLPANAGSFQFATLYSVSCASAGNCTAVGNYLPAVGLQGLLLTETSGTWATGLQAPLPADANSVNPVATPVSVSCASAGNCTAVGDYGDSSFHEEGLLLTETSGAWASGEAAPPANAGSNPGVDPRWVSCASPGNCTAVGQYVDSAGNTQGLLLSQTAGTWATGVEATPPPNAASNPDAIPLSVSCASVGNCTAIGVYRGSASAQGLLLTESSGTWAAGVQAAPPANAGSNAVAFLSSVSCASAGNCTAVGGYLDSAGNTQGLLLNQTAGTWATGVQAALPANGGSNPGARLTSVSCASAGNCTAVGQYVDSAGNTQGLLLTQTSAPDLSLTDTAPAGATSGQPYSYTLTATDTGGSDATGVTVTDTLPASVHFNSAATTQGSCTRTPSTSPRTKDGTVSCTAGGLAAGASVTVTITVTPTTAGTVSGPAGVTAGNVTADSDDTASATTAVQGT